MKVQAISEVNTLTDILESFNIKKGSKILDLFCGIGRHSINLAKMGYEVVGYDPSSYFLKKAEGWARREFIKPERVRFYCGPPAQASSVLRSHGEDSFDAALILFTSFGYSSIQADFEMLKEIQTLANILITETENRDWRITNFQPHIIYRLKQLKIYESWKLNLESSVFEGNSSFYKVKNRGSDLHLALKLKIRMRLYSLHELVHILHRAGWKYLRSYDGYESSGPATANTQNIITVSKSDGVMKL
jgi:SAM-dependent methyltransferase